MSGKLSVSDRFGAYSGPQWRSNLAIKSGGARTVLVIVMLVAVLGIGILAAFIGAKMGEEEEGVLAKPCDCPTAVEKGWKAFSITVIALGIPMLVVFFLFFGCKK